MKAKIFDTCNKKKSKTIVGLQNLLGNVQNKDKRK